MNTIEFLRSFRLGPFAIFDFVMTYLVAYLLGPYLKKVGIPLSREQFLYLALPLSVVAHLIFKQDTPLTQMTLDPKAYWLWKGLLLFMLCMAFVRRSRKA